MGWTLKLLFIIISLLVVLNIFLPDRAEEAINMISENTGLNEDKIVDGINLASDIVKEKSELAKEKVDDNIE